MSFLLASSCAWLSFSSLRRRMIAVWKAQIRYFYLPPFFGQETASPWEFSRRNVSLKSLSYSYIGKWSHTETFTGSRGTVGSWRKSEVHLLKASSSNLKLNLLSGKCRSSHAPAKILRWVVLEIIALLLNQVWTPQGEKRPPFIPA